MTIALHGKLHYHRLIAFQGVLRPSNFGECGELHDAPLQPCTTVQARELPVCPFCASKVAYAAAVERYERQSRPAVAPIPHVGPCQCVRCAWKRKWRSIRLKAGDRWSVGRDNLRYAEEPGTYQWLTGLWSNNVWREWSKRPSSYGEPDHREVVRRAAFNSLSDAGQARLARKLPGIRRKKED